PMFIEMEGNVAKITTEQGIFALKKVSFNQKQRDLFLRQLYLLTKSEFIGRVPIYCTHDGRYIVEENNNEYYLMPWITENNRLEDKNNDFFMMFSTLGRLHKETVQERDMEIE